MFPTHKSPEKAIRPATDAFITDTQAELAVALPGVAKGDVSIEVDSDMILTITAKNSHISPNGATRQQFSSTDFKRSFQLTDEFSDAIEATLANGILTVIIPKVQPERKNVHTITV